MYKSFLKTFPDEFVLECKMTMDPFDFEFWFEATGDCEIIGYVDVEKTPDKGTTEPKQSLLYDGTYYLLVFRAGKAKYYQGSYGFAGGRISDQQVNDLEKGKSLG